MYKIVKKQPLNPTVTRMEIEAPLIAKKAKPGQFIILRVDENGERIPLTVAGYDREKGTVTIIFQIVGATTEKLNHLNEGECLHDFVGPVSYTHLDVYKRQHPDILIHEVAQRFLEVLVEKLHQRRDLLCGAAPVFRGKRVEREIFYTDRRCIPRDGAEILRARRVARRTRQTTLFSPTTVAVHDDRCV